MSNQIEIYKSLDNQVELQVKLDEETVWLSQEQLVVLFERDQSVISRHIRNVFKEGELDEKSTMQKIHSANSDKPVAFYNLDVIISVGYRVKSTRGTQFRQWATQRLKEYLVKGYAINEKRLAEKRQQVEYLKTGIRILSRDIQEQGFTCVHLSYSHLIRPSEPFPLPVQHRFVTKTAPRGGLQPPLTQRLR